MELKGNELGWLIKLAEATYTNDEFQKSIEKHPKLQKFLSDLISRFHDTRFNPGHSETTWVLEKK